ncbi:hypothetical protein B0H10DRAFT_1955667 [Mycena sp. CBHHK59/15]|nr:hypothetical protein B0H10DRAFT_1955667 [Mycena sp. CBHHK59/15]
MGKKRKVSGFGRSELFAAYNCLLQLRNTFVCEVDDEHADREDVEVIVAPPVAYYGYYYAAGIVSNPAGTSASLTYATSIDSNCSRASGVNPELVTAMIFFFYLHDSVENRLVLRDDELTDRSGQGGGCSRRHDRGRFASTNEEGTPAKLPRWPRLGRRTTNVSRPLSDRGVSVVVITPIVWPRFAAQLPLLRSSRAI